MLNPDTALSRDERVKTIETLIKRMSEGDKSAVGELYELVSDDVYAYALSKMRDKADAEDVMHDAFVRVYRFSARYEPRGKPMAWIFKITVNIAKRHLELKRRHISYDENIGEDVPSEDNFEDSLIKNEFLNKLLSMLDESEREIIILHAVSGMKHREIAALLELPLSTVLSKYNRATKKLVAVKEALDEGNRK